MSQWNGEALEGMFYLVNKFKFNFTTMDLKKNFLNNLNFIFEVKFLFYLKGNSLNLIRIKRKINFYM